MVRNEDLITSETFEANLTGFKNLSGLVSAFIEFSFIRKKVGKKKTVACPHIKV